MVIFWHSLCNYYNHKINMEATYYDGEKENTRD